MRLFRFHSVFSKLFASVMLALILFAAAMVLLMQLVQDNSSTMRSQVLASQVVNQIDPFLIDLDTSIQQENRLQARFMLAIVKKSLDIFDESLHSKMGLYDRNGHLLIQTDSSDLPNHLPREPSWWTSLLPPSLSPDTINVHQVQIYSNTGYILLYEPRNPPKSSTLVAALNLFTGTVLLLWIMSFVLWWIARSMTWRINQMSHQIRKLGNGDFSVRVAEQGDDEIAMLAQGFNQAAQKIEQLIDANNLLLAHASHELRTPITRIRLQVEMMDMLSKELSEEKQAQFTKRANAINRDLTGLNDLVESILLVSRLDAGHALQQVESLDLFELVKQEKQHYPQATLYGSTIFIEGQTQLLTHLIRNLLNNAMLHGVPPIEVYVYDAISSHEANIIPCQLLKQAHGVDCDDEMVQSSEQPSDVSQDNVQTLESSDDDKANNSEHEGGYNGINDDEQPTNPSLSDAPLSHELGSDNAETEVKEPKDGIFKKRLRRMKTETEVKPKFAVLAVIDQGDGIPIEKRQDIFSPFVRLKQDKKGSGLGLSLVSQIVEAHRGFIRTDTWQGHTRFLVILPIHISGSHIPLAHNNHTTTHNNHTA